MNGKSKILLMAALLVLVVGIGLAVAQPGSLGDGGDESATPSDETTTTDPDDASPDDTTTMDTSTSSTTRPDDTTTTSVTEVEDSETSATTQPGSGLGSSGAAEPGDTSDGLAATGGRSLLLVGIALGAAGIVARRRDVRPA